MKKSYTLFATMLFSASLGFSQGELSNRFQQEERKALPQNISKVLLEPEMLKSKPKYTKAFNDTVWSEDFNGGPGKFTAVNNNPNSNIWEWNTVYRSGQFSTGVPRIGSTTGANGFMSLPSDFYNTPTPGTGAVPMNTYFVSDKITVPGLTPLTSVIVRFQQYLAYCCNASNVLALEVSTDSLDWDRYDINDELPVNIPNAGSANPVTSEEINISCTVSGVSEFWIRFLADGNEAYWWMIDDIAVVEGTTNDLVLDSYEMAFYADSFAIRPSYYRMPYDLFPPTPFVGGVINDGGNTTNAGIQVSIDHINDPNNNPGLGNVYLNSATVPSLIGPLCDSVLDIEVSTPRFVPTVLGQFTANFTTISDSVDLIPQNNTGSQTFFTSDTIVTREDGTYSAGVGPGNYVSDNGTPGGTTVGDRFGTLMTLVSNTNNAMIPTSISFFVSDDAQNIGVEITPKIWQFDEDSSTVNQAFVGEVASSFIPYTVTASDTNSLLTLPLTSGSAVASGLAAGQYVVGWEVTNLPAGTTFEVFNDASRASLQPNASDFLFLAHAPAEGWGIAGGINPAIRLNIAGLPIPTGINKSTANEVKFDVVPNPNSGLFNLDIVSKKSASYNLNVRNMLGQTVFTKVVSVNGAYTERLDLTELNKGIYFVSLENDNEKYLKKVLVK